MSLGEGEHNNNNNNSLFAFHLKRRLLIKEKNCSYGANSFLQELSIIERLCKAEYDRVASPERVHNLLA